MKMDLDVHGHRGVRGLLPRKERIVEPLEIILDRIFKKLERAERVVHTIDCIVEMSSIPEHDRLEQIRTAISAWYEKPKGGE